MTAAKLLYDLEHMRVELWVSGQQLQYRAPHGVMSEDLRHSIGRHKAELMGLLCDAARLSSSHAARSLGDDNLPLTPHQAWYLSTFDPEHHGWAMTLALDIPTNVSTDLLRATAECLLQEHDAFRLRLYRTHDGQWVQHLLPDSDPAQISIYDLASLGQEAQGSALNKAGIRILSSVSIIQGPVLALGLVRSGGGKPNKLIICLHHYVVDGYSRNLFIGEFLRIYSELAAGQQPKPRPASSSYRDYLLGLNTYTHQATFLARALSFWRSPARLRPVAPLPVDMPGGCHTDINSRRISAAIEPAQWGNLVTYINSRKGVFFNDVLLFGLAQAYYRWTGERSLRLDLEYHGRSIPPGLELLETIGPTTIKFPVILDINPDDETEAALMRLRDSVRQTEDNALGYGFLRYTCADPEIRRELETCTPSQVFLNNRTTLASMNPGPDKRPAHAPWQAAHGLDLRQPGVHENRVSYDLMIECDNFKDSVMLSLVYSSAIHHEKTMRTLSRYLLSSLYTLAGCRPTIAAHEPANGSD